MNPAALAVNIEDLKSDGIVVVNTGNFGERDLEKAKCETNPLTDGTLDGYRVIEVDMNKRVKEALSETELKPKDVQRCKNFYTLGLMYWLFSRPLEPTEEWLKEKFAKKPHLAEANIIALHAGFNAGDIHELFQGRYEVPKCDVLTPGTYRSVMGNEALAIGLVGDAHLEGVKPVEDVAGANFDKRAGMDDLLTALISAVDSRIDDFFAISWSVRVFVAANHAHYISAVALTGFGIDHKADDFARYSANFVGIAGDLHHDDFIP